MKIWVWKKSLADDIIEIKRTRRHYGNKKTRQYENGRLNEREKISKILWDDFNLRLKRKDQFSGENNAKIIGQFLFIVSPGKANGFLSGKYVAIIVQNSCVDYACYKS